MVRKIAIGLFLGCIAALLLVRLGPGSETASRVSVTKAEDMVQAWGKTRKSNDFWRGRPKLKEVTSSEVWERLHAQVFRVEDYNASVSEHDAYLLKDGKVYPMSIGFGGWGLGEMVVCDLDQDASYELVYTYSWGSGMHRSMIEAYSFDGPTPNKISTEFAVANADVHLKKLSAHDIDIYAAEKSGPRLGKLILVRKNGKQLIDIKPDSKLSKKWKANIWRFGSMVNQGPESRSK